MTYAPTVVDLSRLSPPDIVEKLDFEAIVAEMKTDFLTRFPTYDVENLETDTAILIFQSCAYRELLIRARINHAAEALLIAKAGGTDLDHLGAGFGVTRLVLKPADGESPAVMETDERFRRRIQLAPEAFSMGGPRGAYIFHGLTIDPSVHDCWAWQVAPGRVEVVVAAANGGAISDDVIARLVDLYAFEDKTPLTDSVAVKRADEIFYSVSATLVLPRGPDPEAVKAEAEAALAAYAAERDRIGHGVYMVGIDAALKVGGVETVRRDAPVEDLVVNDSQIARFNGAHLDVEVI